MIKKIIKDIIDSICLTCVKRIFHFQYFTLQNTSKYYWITEILNEKKLKEVSSELGCGICFGLLEKYSQHSHLNEVDYKIIELKNFEIFKWKF
jgi:hypothetical protein